MTTGRHQGNVDHDRSTPTGEGQTETKSVDAGAPANPGPAPQDTTDGLDPHTQARIDWRDREIARLNAELARLRAAAPPGKELSK